jgi:hypothetical protein
VIRAISNLVVLAVIVGAVYTLWNWKFAGTADNEAMGYAQSSCMGAIRSRFDTTSVKAHSVRENSNGFTVRGSMTLARGNVAKVTCLTNHNGTVRDVFVD